MDENEIREYEKQELKKHMICTKCKSYKNYGPASRTPHRCLSPKNTEHQTVSPITGYFTYPDCCDMNPDGDCEYWEEKVKKKKKKWILVPLGSHRASLRQVDDDTTP